MTNEAPILRNRLAYYKNMNWCRHKLSVLSIAQKAYRTLPPLGEQRNTVRNVHEYPVHSTIEYRTQGTFGKLWPMNEGKKQISPRNIWRHKISRSREIKKKSNKIGKKLSVVFSEVWEPFEEKDSMRGAESYRLQVFEEHCKSHNTWQCSAKQNRKTDLINWFITIHETKNNQRKKNSRAINIWENSSRKSSSTQDRSDFSVPYGRICWRRNSDSFVWRKFFL